MASQYYNEELVSVVFSGEIFLLAAGKYTLDQIEVEDFQDSEEDRTSQTFSDLSEPEVGVLSCQFDWRLRNILSSIQQA